MKKIVLLLVSLSFVGLVGCGGPYYSRTDRNTDYWGLASPGEQLQAIAIERIKQAQDGTWVPSGPERPGVVTNSSHQRVSIEIIGPEMSGKHLLFPYPSGEMSLSLYEGEVYLYTVYNVDGSVRKFFDKTERKWKIVKNWPLEIMKRPVKRGLPDGRVVDVHWWVDID